MRSLFPDICSDDLDASRAFYVDLFGFEIVFAIDWYVQLKSPTADNLQIAFVRRDHPSVPAAHRRHPQGVLVTIEVDDVAAVHARAVSLGIPVVYALRSEAWGQRHFMAIDPNGLLVDVVQMIPASPEFLRAHGLA